MTDDLVGRLRKGRLILPHPDALEAAARIEALEGGNKALREGLEHIVSECGRMRNGTDDWFDLADMSMSARAALAKDKSDG